MNGSRFWRIDPIAGVAIVVGLFFFFTKRISGTCLAVIILGALILSSLGPLFAIAHKTGQLNFDTSQALVCAGRQQVLVAEANGRKQRWEMLIKLIGFATAALSFLSVLFQHHHVR
jgi:hypothetical protein